MANDFTFEGDLISGSPGPDASAISSDCAETRTWLSLDEWARIMGINPLHFNGLSSTLFNNNVCGEVFFEYSWQHSDRVGRHEIALAIREAELQIAAEAGYNLMPDWTAGERLPYPVPAFAESMGVGGWNPRGLLKSIEAPRGHLITGGVRTKALIAEGAAVTRTDRDTDQFQETCVVTVNVNFTGTNQVRVYYPGQGGSDCYEIRPASVVISGGVATIEFKIWQITALNQKERLDPEPLNAANASSFENRVDVYRVYNDPSKQVQFLWENNGGYSCGSCNACQFGTQDGCFHLKDARLGFLAPYPGTWDDDEDQFTQAEWAVCREPDQVRLWYLSGYMDSKTARPYVELSSYWKFAVAYFAASKLDRPVCGCSNVQQFIEKWREDVMMSNDARSYTVTPEFMNNRLGTTKGALYAYQRIHQNGVRVNK